MSTETEFPHDPRTIVKSIYDEAKLFWCAALSLKFGSAMLGIAFVLSGTGAVYVPWSLATAAILAECAQWRSDLLKGRAEQLKRKIEMFDGLGWPLEPADLSDYLAGVSDKRRKSIEEAVRENYFASEREQGIGRAVENLQESSWWSKQLAGTMLIGCGVAVAVLLGASMLTLGLAVSATHVTSNLENTSRVVSAVITLVVSLGAIPLLSGYFSFARKSEQVEESTKGLFAKAGGPSEAEAIKLIHDYQIARAAAPLIPDLIWKMRRDALNKLWTQYRRGR